MAAAKRPSSRKRSLPPPPAREAPSERPGSEPSPPAARAPEPPTSEPRNDHASNGGASESAPKRRGTRAKTEGEDRGAVLVTGICGRLGRVLARLLHREDRVIGIDRRAFIGQPKDIVHHQFDLRRKKTRDVFRNGDIRAVVHLGVMHDLRASSREHHTWNVVAFQKLLEYVAQYQVPKLVVLSSANVYGPSPDNPQFLTEDAPLLGAQHFSEIRDLVEVDILAQSFFWKHPAIETVILRPCHILGTVKNAPSNYLRLDRPLSLMGFDPMVQVVHQRDVAHAMKLALKPGMKGIFNIKGPSEIPLSRVFRILGKRTVPVPSSVMTPVLHGLWRYRLTSFPTPELDHIRYVCMVDDTRAREVLGFAPRFSLEETVRAVLG